MSFLKNENRVREARVPGFAGIGRVREACERDPGLKTLRAGVAGAFGVCWSGLRVLADAFFIYKTRPRAVAGVIVAFLSFSGREGRAKMPGMHVVRL